MKGVNQLVDIAVCSGCDVVSSIKGELISTIEWDDLVEVEHIRITSGKTSIDNKKTISRVSSHRTNLQNKLSSTFCNFAEEGVLTEEQQVAVNENIEKQRGILHDRILSLMSSGAQITLGKEHGGSRGIRQDRISTILGMYGQSSRYGLVDLEHVTKRRIDPVADRVIKKLLNSGINSLSPPAILCAFRIGIALSLIHISEPTRPY